MFGFVLVFAFFVGFYNCYTVLMFALLVANGPFCINKFEILEKYPFLQYVKKCPILQC